MPGFSLTRPGRALGHVSEYSHPNTSNVPWSLLDQVKEVTSGFLRWAVQGSTMYA